MISTLICRELTTTLTYLQVQKLLNLLIRLTISIKFFQSVLTYLNGKVFIIGDVMLILVVYLTMLSQSTDYL